MINKDDDSDQEIKCRSEQARRHTYARMRKMFTAHHSSLKTRIKAFSCFVWSVLLFGCENCILKTDMIDRLEEFRLRKSWTQKYYKWWENTGNYWVSWHTENWNIVVIWWGTQNVSSTQNIMMRKLIGKRRIERNNLSWLRNLLKWTSFYSNCLILLCFLHWKHHNSASVFIYLTRTISAYFWFCFLSLLAIFHCSIIDHKHFTLSVLLSTYSNAFSQFYLRWPTV